MKTKQLSDAQKCNSIYRRFMSKVEITESCWIWVASCVTAGYGYFACAGEKNIGAHRYSYMYHIGEIPSGLFVCHTCNNTKCVNPDHLYLADCKTNTIHAANDGLLLSGQAASKAKLSEDDVWKVFQLYDKGHSYSEIARLFNLFPSSIERIIKKVNWKYHPAVSKRYQQERSS